MPTHLCRSTLAVRQVAIELPEDTATALDEAAALFEVAPADLIREATIAYVADLAWRRARFGLAAPYRPGPATAPLPSDFRPPDRLSPTRLRTGS